MAAPFTCLHRASPNVKMLFSIIIFSPDITAPTGNPGNFDWLKNRYVPISRSADPVSMFVYIARASAVKIFIPVFFGSAINLSLNSFVFLM